jgi:hypothetical protein
LQEYWTVAAHLLDYFADFASSDSALMLSLWFHLLDTWQETSSFFPCAEVLRTQDLAPDAVQRFTSARWFLEEFRGTVGVLDMLIYGWGSEKQRMGKENEQVVHVPSGDVQGLAGEYNTGPYISGLRSWEQWLTAGSPGIALDPLAPPNTLRSFADREEGKEDEGITRHVPQAGIAIIRTHTNRARNLAEKINPEDNRELLADFDANILLCPTTPLAAQQHTYTSHITGRTVTYQLANGAPPIVRYPGYGDPSMLCSRQDFGLLDEAVGMCRGVEAYVPVSGEGAEQEDGDDSEEEEGEYVEEAFDVWSVYETKGKREVGEGWGELFDSWKDEEKV